MVKQRYDLMVHYDLSKTQGECETEMACSAPFMCIQVAFMRGTFIAYIFPRIWVVLRSSKGIICRSKNQPSGQPNEKAIPPKQCA